MIIPRDEAEAKKFSEIVKQNEAADDWVSEDPAFSPIVLPKKALTILKEVGKNRIGSRKA